METVNEKIKVSLKKEKDNIINELYAMIEGMIKQKL